MLTAFTMTPSGAAVIQQHPSALPALPSPAAKPKFDAAFLERRMAEHRELVAQMQHEHETEIIRRWIARAQ